MKHPTDMDMFMALEMIAAAWVATSPAVITNCFTHTSLVTRAWGELCEMANEILDGLTVDEFICTDEDIIVHEGMTNQAIISSVYEAGDPEVGDPDDP
ncbi:hypothetical protein HPB50_007332 [Hyalomma asiaticum]|uniref:Uncharacterized protein n=1 Tax=Hyalomma asiaticum TaxID=266040 RepID=A0ACB7TDP7_HYAAI|nr:hypothetical protein HPB50_007332 [Hyalomma asiaticum]